MIGELNVDIIARGENIAPEWNREKIIDSCDLVMGSSSAITACVLAAMGADVRFVSVVGDDDFGNFLVRELKRMNVGTEHVQVVSGLRTGCTISLSSSKDRALLTVMGTIGDVEPRHIPQELWQQAAHIHFGSYYLQHQMRPHWASIFELAKSLGISTSFDAGWDPAEDWDSERLKELLQHATFFLPSEDEILAIQGAADLREAFAKLPALRGTVAVKRGREGSVILQPDGTSVVGTSFAVEPIDTTGAGDSFNAGMIYGHLTGLRGEALLRFANACGALAVLRIGGAGGAPTLEQVKQFMVDAVQGHMSEMRSNS